jgi:hypothetical protein
VVVHVDAEVLAEPSQPGQSVLEEGVSVSAETSRRLACDASKVVMTHGADGAVLDVGRKARVVPPAIRRALEHRDGSCRFPGCGLKFCDAHHLEHWAQGGDTKLENLLLLCRKHHRDVHEGGFGVEFLADGNPQFYWPDGRVMPEAGAPPKWVNEPLDALVAQNREEGLEIDEWTSCPDWDGEPMDLDWVMMVLRQEPARLEC